MREQINYTYGEVVATLTMIETPTATAVKTTFDGESTEVDAPLLTPAQKSEKQHLQEVEQDLFLVKQAPVTAKLRTVMKQLRSVGGLFAGLRGLHIFLIYHVVHGAIVSFFSGGEYSAFSAVVSVLASVGLCRIQMVWTHVVISNPSSKPWYRRFPSLKAAKNILLPTAVSAVSQQASMYIIGRLFMYLQDRILYPHGYDGSPDSVRKEALAQMILVVVLALNALVCIIIPAEVTLKRVQASMLPEEEETIVPFDRTFGGKVTPEVLGGSGCVGMRDAWKAFGQEGRSRLFRFYIKLFAIQGAVAIMFVMTLIGELRLIMGDDFERMVEAAKAHVKEQMST